MQTKQVLDKLSRYKTKNKMATILQLLISAFVFYKGETDDVPYSRLFTIFFLYLIYYFYNEHDSSAEKRINDIEAQILFREYAAANNLSKMREYLSIVARIIARNNIAKDSLEIALLRAGDTDRDNLENALHFAVRGDALDAIQFLIQLQTIVDAKFASDLSFRLRFVKPNIINQQNSDGNTPVHLAILKFLKNEKNSETTLLKLLQTEPGGELDYNFLIDPTITNNDGLTILGLIESQENGSPQYTVIFNLIKKITRDYYLPKNDAEFFLAAEKKQLAHIIRYIQASDARKLFVTSDNSQRNIFYYSILSGDVATLSYLLKIIATPKLAAKRSSLFQTVDLYGNTLVHQVMLQLLEKSTPEGWDILFKLLAKEEKGEFGYNSAINPKIKNNSGETIAALVDKLSKGGHEKFSKLYKIVEQIIIEYIPSDDTEFRKAASENRVVSLAKYIRQHGVAKLSATGETSRKNVLHFAVEKMALDSVNLILEVIVQAKNSSSKIELTLINSQDKEGNTPLHIAVSTLINQHNPKMYTIFIRLISNNKAGLSDEKEPLEYNTTIDLSIKNKMGKTVLAMLEEAGLNHCEPLLKTIKNLEQASEVTKERLLSS